MAWREAKSLLALREEVNTKYPNRSTVSDGTIGDAGHATRDSDHNPWVIDNTGIGVVTALDLTHDPASGADMDELAHVLASQRDHRIKYIIRRRKIARSYDKPGILAWSWADYTGTNPHITHMHVSVLPEQSLYDNTSTWNLVEKEIEMPDAVLMRVDGTDPVWCVSAAGRWHVPSMAVLGGLRFMGLVRKIDGTSDDVAILPANQQEFLDAFPIISNTFTVNGTMEGSL